MRAEIDEKGILRVYPDSETEQGALWAWCDRLEGAERSLIASKLLAFSFDDTRQPLKSRVRDVPVEYSAGRSEGERKKVFDACMDCVSDKRLSEALIQGFLAVIRHKV